MFGGIWTRQLIPATAARLKMHSYGSGLKKHQLTASILMKICLERGLAIACPIASPMAVITVMLIFMLRQFNMQHPPCLISIGSNKYQCSRKKWVITVAPEHLPIHCSCRNNPPDLRPAAEKLGISTADIKHYAHALACWVAAGMPTRKQTEVEQLEVICQKCEHYRKGRCAKCGCCVNKSRVAVHNKIKMGSEHCPIGKW